MHMVEMGMHATMYDMGRKKVEYIFHRMLLSPFNKHILVSVYSSH